MNSEVGGVERLGKKLTHLDLLGFAFEVREDDRNVAAEFPAKLAAGTAGCREGVGVRDDYDGVEAAFTFADGFEDGDAFGANSEAVGGVLYIAAAEDAAGGGAESGAYAEVGVWGVSVLARLFGDGDQVIVIGHARKLA